MKTTPLNADINLDDLIDAYYITKKKHRPQMFEELVEEHRTLLQHYRILEELYMEATIAADKENDEETK